MIDQDRLDELANDFGAEDLAEIIEVFLGETWEAIEELEGKIGAMSDEEQRDQFHFLKGCARNIGAMQFGEVREGFETGGKTFGQAEYLGLKADFQAVCDALSDRGLRMSA